MEAFKTLERLSYYDESDVEAVSFIDALYAMKLLVKELKDVVDNAQDINEIKNFLKTIK